MLKTYWTILGALFGTAFHLQSSRPYQCPWGYHNILTDLSCPSSQCICRNLESNKHYARNHHLFVCKWKIGSKIISLLLIRNHLYGCKWRIGAKIISLLLIRNHHLYGCKWKIGAEIISQLLIRNHHLYG